MTRDDGELLRRFQRLARTRAEHREQLRRRARAPEVAAARERSLAALEDYIAALHDQCLPVPPRLHRDLTILRALSNPGRKPAPPTA